MLFRAFVNLRVGTIVRLMDFFRLLFGFSGRSFVDEFFFFFNIDFIFFFFSSYFIFLLFIMLKKDVV